MNSFKHLLVFIFSVFYLFLSTGVTLFRTHCECSGSNSVSLFVASETCNEIIPDHDCCSEEQITHENCQIDHLHHDCGCTEPIITYLKLTNHFGEDSNLEYPIAKQFSLVHFAQAELIQIIDTSANPQVFPNYSPPENLLYGRFLITFLNQRKIALFA